MAFVCLLLALVTLDVYWPVTRHAFTNYDDPDYVSENSKVQSGLTLDGVKWAFTTGYAGNWHPLTWLSHMLDWQLFGPNPGAHHLVNLLIHVLNAALLFLLSFSSAKRTMALHLRRPETERVDKSVFSLILNISVYE